MSLLSPTFASARHILSFRLNPILVAATFQFLSFKIQDSRLDVDLTLPIIAFCSAAVFNHARRSKVNSSAKLNYSALIPPKSQLSWHGGGSSRLQPRAGERGDAGGGGGSALAVRSIKPDYQIPMIARFHTSQDPNCIIWRSHSCITSAFSE